MAPTMRRFVTKRAGVPLLAAALCLSGCQTTSSSGQQPVAAPTPSMTSQQVWNDVQSGTEGFALLGEITGIGPRLTGSDNGRRAEEWALRQFRDAGFADAHFAPFTFDHWERGPLALTIDGAPVRAVSFGGSPARSTLSTEIVDMANGIDADFAAAPDKVRGKVALIYLTVLPDSPDETPFLMRWDKIRLAAKYGAKGVIFINRGQGNALATGTAWRQGPLPFPVLLMGHDEGLALRARLAKAPLALTLDMTNKTGPAIARNIVATLPGTDPTAPRIVFGAHLDSWDLSAGAIDNGVGAATLIDIARIFKERGYRPRRPIEFVLYMGEEQGEIGSEQLLRQQAAAGTEAGIGYMIDSDMSYDPAGFNSWGFDVGSSFYPQLAAELKALGADFSAEIANRPMPGGDPEPYVQYGIPALYIAGRNGPDAGRCQHGDCDNIDIVREDRVAYTSAVSAVTLLALANAETLPVSRLEGADIEAYLARTGLKRGGSK
ncbi:M28 family peptidase [Sphingopyxis panaciterrae]